MYSFGAPEQPPEEYEEEFRDVEDIGELSIEAQAILDEPKEDYIPYVDESGEDICIGCQNTGCENYIEPAPNESEKFDGVTPKGGIVPINPEITDHIGKFGGTWERCKVCGSEEFVRFDGHWVCAYDYVEYLTNIQF